MIFHLQPWAPRTVEIANLLIGKIRTVAPELEVLFMGAAALGLPGKNDVDLDILCGLDEIEKYKRLLIPVMGEPKAADEMVIWEFTLEGFEIDAILSDPSISHVPEQRAVFDALKANPVLRNAYKRLKEDCDGLPYSEYEARKNAFFKNEVLS